MQRGEEEEGKKSGGKRRKVSSRDPSFLSLPRPVVGRCRRATHAANFIPSLVYSDRRPPRGRPRTARGNSSGQRERERERERKAITGNIKHGNFQKGCTEEEEEEGDATQRRRRRLTRKLSSYAVPWASRSTVEDAA